MERTSICVFSRGARREIEGQVSGLEFRWHGPAIGKRRELLQGSALGGKSSGR
ncbi:MAG: hypothetical protein WA609_18935 [Terriglobales bacterium]